MPIDYMTNPRIPWWFLLLLDGSGTYYIVSRPGCNRKTIPLLPALRKGLVGIFDAFRFIG